MNMPDSVQDRANDASSWFRGRAKSGPGALERLFDWYVDTVDGWVNRPRGEAQPSYGPGGPRLNREIDEAHEQYLGQREIDAPGVGGSGDGAPAYMGAQSTQGHQWVEEPPPEELNMPEAPVSGFPLRMTEELQEPSEMEMRIQEGLVRLGAQIEVDGYAGPRTIEALNEIFGLQLGPGDEIPASVLEELLG